MRRNRRGAQTAVDRIAFGVLSWDSVTSIPGGNHTSENHEQVERNSRSEIQRFQSDGSTGALQDATNIYLSNAEITVANHVAPYFKILRDLFKAWPAKYGVLKISSVPLIAYWQIRDIVMRTIVGEENVTSVWLDDMNSRINLFIDEICRQMGHFEVTIGKMMEENGSASIRQNVSPQKACNRTLLPVYSRQDVIAFSTLLSDVPGAKCWCVPVTLGLTDEDLRQLKATCDAVISFSAEYEEELKTTLEELKVLLETDNMAAGSSVATRTRYKSLCESLRNHLGEDAVLCTVIADQVTYIDQLTSELQNMSFADPQHRATFNTNLRQWDQHLARATGTLTDQTDERVPRFPEQHIITELRATPVTSESRQVPPRLSRDVTNLPPRELPPENLPGTMFSLDTESMRPI